MARISHVSLLVVAALAPGRGALAQAPQPVALVGVHVVDVERGTLLRDRVVLVRGNRIEQVAPAGTFALPRGTRVIRADGRFVIPGLWDMHVHQLPDTRLPMEPPRAEAISLSRMQSLFIAAGVTGVRDMGGDLGALRATQRDIERGRIVGPRIVATGQKLGSHAVVPGAPFPVRTAEDVARSIALLRDSGAAHVKIEGLASAHYRVALEACQTYHIPCTSHVSPELSPAELSEQGIRSLEHLFILPQYTSLHSMEQIRRWRAERSAPAPWQRALYRLRLRPRPPTSLAVEERHDSTGALALFRGMARNGTWVTPTLMVHELVNRVGPLDTLARNEAFMTEPLRKEMKRDTRPAREVHFARRLQALQFRLVRELRDAGVGILAGTDAPLQCAPGFAIHGELMLLQRAGLRPIEALRAATLEPARYLGATDTLGTIQPRHVADLVVLRGNPLDDVAHTREIDMVMSRGRLFTRQQLDSLARNAESPLDSRPGTRR